jgi:hypothetical protein
MCTKVWLESLKGRECSENPGVDGRIISVNHFWDP